jgi:hypothetical protein
MLLAVGACGESMGAGPGADSGRGGAGGQKRTAAAEVVILAAGDIACSGCAQAKTAALLGELSRGGRAAAILPLGDNAYSDGSLSDFQENYAPSWGVPELLALTHPVPGNHEYLRADADGYFDYFNGVGAANGIAGERGKGYYSFDVGAWHVVALNSSDGCNAVSCAAGSPQQIWLAQDLAANRASCALAYWHQPRFQGGTVAGDSDALGPLWDTFHDAGGDVVVSAHEHNYQQLQPLDKAGAPDPARGIRSFVVGTGGAGFHTSFGGPHEPAVEARVVSTHGVLELTLAEGGYRWRFVTVDGAVPAGASGSAACH